LIITAYVNSMLFPQSVDCICKIATFVQDRRCGLIKLL